MVSQRRKRYQLIEGKRYQLQGHLLQETAHQLTGYHGEKLKKTRSKTTQADERCCFVSSKTSHPTLGLVIQTPHNFSIMLNEDETQENNKSQFLTAASIYVKVLEFNLIPADR